MIWPVPLRGSTRQTPTASSSDATSLSMPNTAMCTGGSVVVRSALPSLVTSTMVPVSAMAMFAPEMPTVASMNFWRSVSRAWSWIASTVASVPNTAAASSFVRWIAGAMRCDGRVCVSCTMRSPRSVSTTSIPRPSRYALSSISSVAIDLLLVTTMRFPAGSPLPAFQHSWPMMSRASAALAARCTTPPTAARRWVNCSSSSGRRSRLALRRRLRSARPAAKSKLSKAALRRPRRPVIAWISAFWRFGSSSALLTRREKCLRLSGTRSGRFSDGLRQRGRCRHRRQAYGPDTHDCPLVTSRIDHGIWMRDHRRVRQLWVPGRHLDGVSQAVERAGEHRRHQPVGLRQGRHRFERLARALPIRRRRITGKDVELGQRHPRHRVLGNRLDALAEPAQLVTAGVVEITAELGIGVTVVEVGGKVERDLHPLFAQSVLICADGGPERPDLVAELTTDPLGMRHAFAAAVGTLEERLEKVMYSSPIPRLRRVLPHEWGRHCYR